MKDHTMLDLPICSPLPQQPQMMASIPHSAEGDISFLLVPHIAAEWRDLYERMYSRGG